MAHMTICGAGIFGLSIAWEALKRGARVTVIDPAGAGAGASGGVVGALQPHTPDPWNDKKQFQLESLLAAETFWPVVETASGLPSGYARIGRLLPLASDREVALARGRTEAARENWGAAATWQVIEGQAGNPWTPPSPTGLFVHDTLSAILHPRQATQSLAAAVTARGGVILADAAPEPPVVWATGWQGLLDLNRALNRHVGSGVKGQALLLDHDARGQPQIFAGGIHVIPHLDGTVAIGSTTEREFDDPKTTDARLDDLLARAGALMPVLQDAPVLARWAGVRPRATSRAPLLGPWPGREGHFIAHGGFKIGFGMAPKCAALMADLVLDGNDRLPEAFHTRTLSEQE